MTLTPLSKLQNSTELSKSLPPRLVISPHSQHMDYLHQYTLGFLESPPTLSPHSINFPSTFELRDKKPEEKSGLSSLQITGSSESRWF